MKHEKTGPTHEELYQKLRHRDVGIALVAGHGVEVGALHFPQRVPNARAVDYVDVEDVPTLRGRFPELGDEPFVPSQWLGDVVRDTIPAITGRRYDFVIANHVLEHVVNPIQVISNLWEGIVDGGHLVLSIPDKRFTFDHLRSLTPFEHLVDEYTRGVTTMAVDHFLELVGTTDPDAMEEPYGLCAALEMARDRREHAHVWDSDTFKDFWTRTAELLELRSEVLFESTGDDNAFEYFAVIGRSLRPEAREDDALRMLAGVWSQRIDLQRAFPATHDLMARGLLAWATTSGVTIDSDAAALRPFRLHYQHLLIHSVGDGQQLEARLRASLR